MPESQENDENVELSLSAQQLLFAVLVGIFVMYFSATITIYFQKKPMERSLVQLVYPFETGPSAEKLHRKGVKRFKNEHYGQAVQFFSRSLAKNSDNTKGLFLLASTNAKLGKFERALRQIQLLEEGGAKLSRIPVKKAYWLLGLGRFEEARAAAQNYVERSDPPKQNKFYGYMILYTISRLAEDSVSTDEVRNELESLNLGWDQWPMLILRRLEDKGDETRTRYDNRGRETEYRAWKAMFELANHNDEQAREHRDWVLREGDPSVYEYDLMLATKASKLFETSH